MVKGNSGSLASPSGWGPRPVFLLESVGMTISCYTVLSSLSVRPPGLCERYTSGTRHFLKQYLVLSYLGWFKTIVIKGVQHRNRIPSPLLLDHCLHVQNGLKEVLRLIPSGLSWAVIAKHKSLDKSLNYCLNAFLKLFF